MHLMTSAIIHRLGRRDRQLLQRWALRDSSSRKALRLWSAITQLGGAPFALACSLLPLAWPGRGRAAAQLALTVLLVSHALVQLVKRSVVRARPVAELLGTVDVIAPDCFSFPSGHAAAAMAVAFGYGFTFPGLAGLFAALAVLVGCSRVALGVHYPGDVVAGQMLALLTGVVVVTW